jgi:hypothetical protein
MFIHGNSHAEPFLALSETMITGRIKAAILADPGMAARMCPCHDGVMRIDNHLSTLPQ